MIRRLGSPDDADIGVSLTRTYKGGLYRFTLQAWDQGGTTIIHFDGHEFCIAMGVTLPVRKRGPNRKVEMVEGVPS